MMRAVSLFAGIGGLELGLERARVARVALQCELEPFPREALARHWPHARRHDDVRTLRLSAGEADIICGGFPCQDISTAGEGAGIKEGTRSGLWLEYARLVREGRPAWVVVENVSALLARGLGIVAGDLTAAGYDLAWDCVPAAAVGAPHRRDVCAPPLCASERAFAAGIARVRAQGARWPSRPGEAQHAWEPPRTARGVPDRAKRLRALGNAVAPAVAEAVGYALAGIRDAAPASEEASAFARFDGRAFLPAQAGLFGAAPVTRWPRAGTVRDGVAYELAPAGPIARDGAQWATPSASLPNDGESVESFLARRETQRARGVNGNGMGTPLAVQVRVDWPTPTVKGNHNRVGVSATSGDGLATAVRDWPTPRAEHDSGRHRGEPDTLHSAVKAQRDWPTPMSRDGKDTGDMSRVNARAGRPADTLPRVAQAVGDTAPLNPAWVEALMGFPVGWTDARAARAREAA